MLTFIEGFVNRRETGFYDRQDRFPHNPRMNYPLEWLKKKPKTSSLADKKHADPAIALKKQKKSQYK